MANPPLLSNSNRWNLQPDLIAFDSDPPLPEDAARRAANYAMAKVAKAKKEWRKAKKERARL